MLSDKASTGTLELKQRFLRDYQRRKQEFERSYSDSFEESESDQEPEEEGSNFKEILAIGFDSANFKNHNTDKYELQDKGIPVPIFRRGDPFSLNVHLNEDFNPEKNTLQLIVYYGTNPSYNKSTVFDVFLSEKDEKNIDHWQMRLEETNGADIKIKICSPVKCQVGVWGIKLKLLPKDDTTSEIFKGVLESSIYILFNPWCKDDEVYLDDEAKRQEYVLNDSANIYYGTYNKQFGNRWLFGQFDFAVLPAVLLMLEHSQLQDHAKGSAILMARAISAVVNANDDQGLIVGKWDGNYGDGTAPMSWTGSTAIYEEYLKGRGDYSVKYGECWVFAGCAATACRALGIPCRVITGFNAAHDTDGSLTLDVYIDQKGNTLYHHPMTGQPLPNDSVWNFHVWNEVWMARPDLPPGYSGWQIIDATPQQKSKGLYQAGPCPKKAILNGDMGLQFDVPFIFAEVNADKAVFMVDQDSPWGFSLAALDEKYVGCLILTDRLGLPDGTLSKMENITNTYKYQEETEHNKEREIYMKALAQLPKAQRLYDRISKFTSPSVKNSVDFHIKKMSSITFGENFDVVVSMQVLLEQQRTVDVSLSALTMEYNGNILETVKEGKVQVDIEPLQVKTCKLHVLAEDYKDKLQKTTSIKVSVFCQVRDTEQFYRAEEVFEIIKAVLNIEVAAVAYLQTMIKAKFSMKNTYNVVLTNCVLRLEGSGLKRPTVLPIKDVQAGEFMVKTVKLMPRRRGPSTLVAIFNSDQLTNVKGSTIIMVQ